MLLARHAGLEGEELDVVARAAELHDVGKIAIPERVLRKRGALTEVEKELMRKHTLIGERILAAAPAMVPGREARALEPRALGRVGYPGQARRARRSRSARGSSPCATRSTRWSPRSPTARRSTPAAALEELRRCAGTQFDPWLVGLFCEYVHPQVGDWAVERSQTRAAPSTAPARVRE